jgi:hypothetical protein
MVMAIVAPAQWRFIASAFGIGKEVHQKQDENNLGSVELRIRVEALQRIRVSIFIFLRIEVIGPQAEASAKIELPIPVCLDRAGLDTA